MNGIASLRTDARTKSTKELLNGQKYSIDYYQREYKWQRKHILELLGDLENQFLLNFETSHKRSEVESYTHYFLGSIVISSRGGKKYIIDGQQRLTSITLLLIYLNNLQATSEAKVDIAPLIFSEKFGKKSFNLDITERNAIIEALYNGELFDTSDHGESVQNIDDRYQDIVEFFPDDLKGNALPYFIDWLTECVDFVEITAFSDEEAYTIFETMNDRGLSLSPTDMLKGYLLANLDDESARENLNNRWKNHMANMVDANIDDPSDFFKSWLRARYAQTIRGSAKGETNKDYERIVNEFHKWVRDERNIIGLHNPSDFRAFVQRDLEFYVKQYIKIRKAASSFDFAVESNLEEIHYNANNGYTLQYMFLLACLEPTDSDETIYHKLKITSIYLDIWIVRRFVNFKTTSREANKGRAFNWILRLRGMNIEDIIDSYLNDLAEMDKEGLNFESVKDFYMHQQNRRRVHHILARMTYALEQWSGLETSFDRYSSTKARTRFEIEHIWANRHDRHIDEFPSETDFLLYRNRLGGLILLPRGTNQSYNDSPYAVKIRHYIKENLLAQSLHPQAYELNPNFLNIIQRYDFSFEPHTEFKREDLDKRQNLYKELCEVIWSPSRISNLRN